MDLKFTFFVLLIFTFNLIAGEPKCSSPELSMHFSKDVEDKLFKFLLNGGGGYNMGIFNVASYVCDGTLVPEVSVSSGHNSIVKSIKFNMYAQDGSFVKSFEIIGLNQDKVLREKGNDEVLKMLEGMDLSKFSIDMAENGITLSNPTYFDRSNPTYLDHLIAAH